MLYSLGGGRITVDLTDETATFDVLWFNPRTGKYPAAEAAPTLAGGQVAQLNAPASATAEEDWVVLLRRR